MMTQQISLIYITSGGTEVLCSRLTVRLIAEKYVERQTCVQLLHGLHLSIRLIVARWALDCPA